jgi:hypothetical protein
MTRAGGDGENARQRLTFSDIQYASLQLRARLVGNDAPPTVELFWRALPIEGPAFQGMHGDPAGPLTPVQPPFTLAPPLPAVWPARWPSSLLQAPAERDPVPDRGCSRPPFCCRSVVSRDADRPDATLVVSTTPPARRFARTGRASDASLPAKHRIEYLADLIGNGRLRQHAAGRSAASSIPTRSSRSTPLPLSALNDSER